MRKAALIEGTVLLLLGIAVAWFALFGNYEYLMNPKFRWLTVTGSALVACMGVILLLAPRGRPGLSGLAAFAAIAAIVLAGKPYAYDVNSLTLPDQGISGVPLTIGDARYEFIGLNELNTTIVVGKEGYDGRRIVVTGLLKRTPGLASSGQIAVMRPLSVCCVADALLVGILAEGRGDSILTDQWVNVYGTVRRLDTPLIPPKIHHKAIRYASVSTDYILEADSIAPYVRPRPKFDIMEKLADGGYGKFVELARRAGLPEMLKEYEVVTVLAPVDAAIDALPDGFVDELLEKKNRERLIAFVGGHVLIGRLMDHELRGFDSAETITGGRVNITIVNGALKAGGSRFLFENIEASNGVIHAIYPAVMADIGD